MPIYFRNTPVTMPFMFDSVGNHWYQKSMQRPNGHPHYHYLQTEKGRGRIEIRGKHYILEEQEGILIAPSVPHSYTKESEEWDTVFATFTGTLSSGISSILQNQSVVFVSKEQGCLIECIISDAVSEFQKSIPDMKVLSTLCYDLLLAFTPDTSSGNLTADPLYQRYVAPTVREIETRYSEELTVRELSSQVFVTPQYLSRLFRKFLGVSVYEYLTGYRINKAKELLLTHTHMKIQEISLASGFTDTSHFISIFRKYTGTTPLDFRKVYHM